MLTTLGSWIYWCIWPLICTIIVYLIITHGDLDRCVIDRIKGCLIILPFSYLIGILSGILVFMVPFCIAYSDATVKTIAVNEMSIKSLSSTDKSFQIGQSNIDGEKSYIVLVYKDSHYEPKEVRADKFKIVCTDSTPPKISIVVKDCTTPKKFKWLFNEMTMDNVEEFQYGTIYVPKRYTLMPYKK